MHLVVPPPPHKFIMMHGHKNVRFEVIGLASFREGDGKLNPSNTCDYHVPGETVAWKMFKLKYALMLLNKKCLNLAKQGDFKGY